METAATVSFFTLVRLVADLAVIATAIFVFFQLGAASSQLRIAAQSYLSAAQAERTKLAFDFIRRWNDDPQKAIRSQVFEILRNKSLSDEEKFRRLNENPAQRAVFRANLNFFEEMGLAYKRNAVDRDVIFEFFGFLAVLYWEGAKGYIMEMRRTEQDKKIDENFESLYDEMRARKRTAQGV